MKHKTVQYLIVFWLLLFVICALWARLIISQASEDFHLLSQVPGQTLPLLQVDTLILDIQKKLLLPASFFALGSLSAVLFILARIFADLRHATNAARYSLDRPDGDKNSLLPLDRSGETSGLQAAIQDLGAKARFAISHQKDEKLRLKDYLSDISHQLRTPLASLRLYNELLGRNQPEEEDRKNFINAQGKQIERMEWLIADLMTLARLDADTVEMEMEKQALRPTIELAVEPFWMRAAQEKKRLIVRCSPSIMIPHDRKWVAESIGNIIKNALEHTEEGGRIDVNCIETPLTVQIDIEDDGEGIDPEDHPHIFKRFYGKKTSRHPDSIGIGLALSQMILEKNQARIYAENRSDRGARFHIVFLKHFPAVVE